MVNSLSKHIIVFSSRLKPLEEVFVTFLYTFFFYNINPNNDDTCSQNRMLLLTPLIITEPSKMPFPMVHLIDGIYYKEP